jgi:hypothetical protein
MTDRFADREFDRDQGRARDADVNDQRHLGVMAHIVNTSGLTRQEWLAFLVAGFMTIGPLFAAFYGRMHS